MTAAPQDFIARLRRAVVVPVVTIEDSAAAVPLGRALMAGGINVVEITLRTPAALDAIGRLARALPEMMVGAGTVLTPRHAEESIEAGAQFLVSPGLTPRLAAAGMAAPVPMLPGVATASEAMAAAEYGFSILKFFPAEAVGGSAALKALAGPLPDVRFCPTGGIDPANAASYLSLPNVVCVGGSWLTPANAVQRGDWAAVTALAKAASALKGVA
jgi:2-dehydro-3-deoxyphosphogluconate aldolase/(4S)-4-hydroxy-2-oxoglutarate aldolase